MAALNAPTEHGGIVVPLDMFRVSHLAALASEVLVGKARNILDAKMVLTRHPSSQIVLITLVGSVIGDEPVTFWRENADLAVAMSQVLRTQCFLYYAKTAPAEERREGFVVAQQGRPLAADDASADSQPASGEGHWPVTKLCEQLRIDMADLANGFEGGPSVELSLVEPQIDDQAALMTLAGQQPEGAETGDGAPGEGGGEDKPKPPPKPTVEADLKRRAKEKEEEAAALRERKEQVQAGIAYAIDDLGIVVTPPAELGEPDVLAPFVVHSIEGDLPSGLPSNETDALQGKRCDIAVAVDFLSELFIGNSPLSRPQFEEGAKAAKIGGKDVRTMEVLAPRLGYGTLISTGKAPHVFVSRKPDLPMPDKLIADLLSK